MIRLDAATVLLQWAVGGLLFLWVTSRRRQVGIGYGWLLRGVYGTMAALSVVAGRALEPATARDLCAIGVTVATFVAFAVSVARRKAGVAGERARRETARRRVRAMVGDRPGPATDTDAADGPEFPPWLDLLAPAIGLVGLVFAGLDAGGPDVLAVVRTVVGAVFLGCVSDAMLLGHWYLVQPGLGREPLLDLVRWLALVWPLEVGALLWPTGMLSVIAGTVDDGWNGTLGWFWLASAATTLILCAVTRAALKERAYSAVMAATGLLYLAILTAFGTDLVARAVLAGFDAAEVSFGAALAILAAGLAAGTVNAIVGSGSLITFPTLLALGYEPVVANVSNTIGLVPGSISGTIGYRRELEGQAGRIRALSLASMFGGITGAILLLVLPGSVFEGVVPVLILVACALVAAQPRLARRSAAKPRAATHSRWLPVTIYATGIYGGYFGAAQGVVLIALLGIFLDDHLQRLNALKNLLAALVNGVAAVIFILVADVAWEAAGLLAAGAIVGGQIGARVGRRIPAPLLRVVIVVVGTAVAVRLLLT